MHCWLSFLMLMPMLGLGLDIGRCPSVRSSEVPAEGMFVRFRADANITLLSTENPKVLVWDDSSDPSQPVSQFRLVGSPMWVRNSFKGRPAVAFNGASGLSGTYVGRGCAPPTTIVAICKVFTTTNGVFFMVGEDGPVSLLQSGGSLYVRDSGGSDPNRLVTTLPSDYFCMIVRLSNTSLSRSDITCRVNGTQYSLGNRETFVGAKYAIGMHDFLDPQEFSTSNIVELLVYSRSLSDAECQQVERYANI